MTETEKYKKAKAELGYSNAWVDMIGKHYDGGGGGIGKVVSAGILGSRIYYQEHNGSNNYWDIPEGLKPFINEVLRDEMPSLAAKAIALQQKHVEALADKAVKELRAAMEDAGLDLVAEEAR